MEVVGLLASFAFAVTALSVGVDAVDEFAVFIETVYFRPSQCVGNDGMVFAVGETAQFFAVASVNGSQIAVAVVGGGDLVEVVRKYRILLFVFFLRI